MPEYYLRVSSFINHPFEDKTLQYNHFAIYDKDRTSAAILKWMLADVIRKHDLTTSSTTIEQFSKM